MFHLKSNYCLCVVFCREFHLFLDVTEHDKVKLCTYHSPVRPLAMISHIGLT